VRKRNNKPKTVLFQGYLLGGLAAGGLLAVLLAHWHVKGTPVPPSLNSAHFSVAVLAGAKQAEQKAPENVDKVADAVAPSPTPVNVPVVAAKRETSLPKAVKAAQEATPSKDEVTKPVEVLPPAQVSMPGGHLMAEDAPIGDDATPDPFELKPRQVYIRLQVDADGHVVRSGILRSGGDQMRDSLILKAMRSRTYSTKDMRVRVDNPGTAPLYQLDMVLDYGNNDFLP
jgi:outer membrane biosynthesis protein TonB